MISKYLADIGVKEKDMPINWNQGDSREQFWENQRKEYGCDERETWSLDYSFALWLYPRLKMYNEVNIINTTYHNFEYNGSTLTMQQCIDKILEGLEIYLTVDDFKRTQDDLGKITDSRMLFAIILGSLWW